MRMKQRFLPLLRSLSVFIAAFTAFTCGAEKIDNTHYRFCVMDDAEITDYDAVKADNDNRLPYFTSSAWYSENGVKIDGDKTEIRPQNNVTSTHVLMRKTYDGTNYSLYHSWNIGYNGVAYDQSTKFYITVQAPSGVSLEHIPAKALIGDEISFKTKLEGTFPSFSGHGYFEYIYFSSDENVATVSEGKITARNPGKANITVRVIARNSKYNDLLFPLNYYSIGEATAEIEVVDNLDPTDISLSSRELSLDMGQQETLTATLTPEDARTDITWSSSDESVATVEDGLIKAVGRGNASIEARTSNGLSAKCYVTVLGDQDYSGVCIDGLYYDLDRKEHTAAVVHENPNEPNYSYISGEIVIPEKIQCYGADYTVTKIDKYAFLDCEITSAKLPESITSIGHSAFLQSHLENITLPDGLKEIGELAFRQTKLESIIIGPNVSLIGDGAFADCRDLKAVYVDDGNPYFVIYKYCLYNAAKTRLYYVPINNSTVSFPDSLETIGAYACYSNQAVSSIQFPESLITIEHHAFENCVNIESLSFPNSLMEIGDYAFFYSNNLKEIVFGNKLKMIGENAFMTLNGNRLKVVRISALNPPTVDHYYAFYNRYEATLVVPLGRVSTYKKDSVWGRFATITDDENDPALGVESIRDNDIAKTHPDVYDLNGVLLIQGATKEEIRSLPAGVYIIGDKQIVIR